MLSLEEAHARLLATIEPLVPETVPLAAASGRILAQPLSSPVDLPPFDNSAMDGYAVRSEDVRNATKIEPAWLRIVGEIPAGSAPALSVSAGTAVRIFTGSALPDGADAVVMQEDTERKGEDVAIIDGVKPLENVRLRGEDIKRGETVGVAGDRLDAGLLALLAATGIGTVKVGSRPVIALFSTGNELIAPGATPTGGQIFESNSIALASLATAAGAEARVLPAVRDTLEETRAALEKAFAECDAIVTTGGVSVGEHDYVKAAFEGIGGKVDFWKVAIRPGKPFVFGRCGKKFLFGLPGNPVSAFVTFLLLVRPAILKWQGAIDTGLGVTHAILLDRISNESDRRHFMRVAVDQAGNVRSSGPQASHRLASLAKANGLLDVAPGAVLEQGKTVRVLRW